MLKQNHIGASANEKLNWEAVIESMMSEDARQLSLNAFESVKV
jgi:hypothetical protein